MDGWKCFRIDLPMSAVVGAPGSSIDEVVQGLDDARSARLARVSRLLHDEIGPTLCALGLQIDLLLGEKAADIQHHLERVIEKVRSMSYFSHENLAGRFGLARASEHFAEFVDPSYHGSFELVQQAAPDLAPDRSQAVFEAATDALWLLSRCRGTSLIGVTLTQEGIELRSNSALESVALLHYRAARSALSVEIDSQSSSTLISIRS